MFLTTFLGLGRKLGFARNTILTGFVPSCGTLLSLLSRFGILLISLQYWLSLPDDGPDHATCHQYDHPEWEYAHRVEQDTQA